jgi:hypothetical protein
MLGLTFLESVGVAIAVVTVYAGTILVIGTRH